MSNAKNRFAASFTFGQGAFRAIRINSWLFAVEQTGAYAAHIGTFSTESVTDRFSLEYKAMVQLQHQYEIATNSEYN